MENLHMMKPCPFCGGEAMLFASEDGGVIVICRQCKARTKTCIDTLYYSKPTNAVERFIEAWNRRVDDGK